MDILTKTIEQKALEVLEVYSGANNYILSLKTKTSLDINDLNTKVLKKVADLISTSLSHVINLSFDTGVFTS